MSCKCAYLCYSSETARDLDWGRFDAIGEILSMTSFGTFHALLTLSCVRGAFLHPRSLCNPPLSNLFAQSLHVISLCISLCGKISCNAFVDWRGPPCKGRACVDSTSSCGFSPLMIALSLENVANHPLPLLHNIVRIQDFCWHKRQTSSTLYPKCEHAHKLGLEYIGRNLTL